MTEQNENDPHSSSLGSQRSSMPSLPSKCRSLVLVLATAPLLGAAPSLPPVPKIVVLESDNRVLAQAAQQERSHDGFILVRKNKVAILGIFSQRDFGELVEQGERLFGWDWSSATGCDPIGNMWSAEQNDAIRGATIIKVQQRRDFETCYVNEISGDRCFTESLKTQDRTNREIKCLELRGILTEAGFDETNTQAVMAALAVRPAEEWAKALPRQVREIVMPQAQGSPSSKPVEPSQREGSAGNEALEPRQTESQGSTSDDGPGRQMVNPSR